MCKSFVLLWDCSEPVAGPLYVHLPVQIEQLPVTAQHPARASLLSCQQHLLINTEVSLNTTESVKKGDPK